MDNLPSWAGSIVAVAVGLAPGLLVLSAGFIARLLLRVAEMLQPKAEQSRLQQNHKSRSPPVPDDESKCLGSFGV